MRRRLAGYAVVALLTSLLASLPRRLSVTTDVLALLIAVIAVTAAVKQQQQRLAAAVEAPRAIAEADRTRTALLAAVSHDLRTPLADYGTGHREPGRERTAVFARRITAAAHGQHKRRPDRATRRRPWAWRPPGRPGSHVRAFRAARRHARHDRPGLGLTLARGLTEAMRGTLEPEMTPGGGLTRTISLPAAATP
jgi:K+-sensing histidine kinase KdpD